MVRKPQVQAPDRLVPDGFCACPVDIAFNVVGKKWTVLLIRNMLRGHRHFNELLSNIRGLNPRTLSSRLKGLEHEKLILKRVSSTTPLRVDYELTDKGHAVLPILEQMVRWSVVWAPDQVFGEGKRRRDIEACIEEWETVLLGARNAANGAAPEDPAEAAKKRRSATVS